MPILEFYCPNNHRIYQFYARSMADAESTPLCPDGKSFVMQKQVSRFAVLKGAQPQDQGDLFQGLTDQQIQEAMQDLQSGYESLDDKRPDARELGALMKKFEGLLGDRASPELKELIRRLDRGEDPTELEQMFADVEQDRDLFSALKSRLVGAPPPVRDPKLYEMRDYLEA